MADGDVGFGTNDAPPLTSLGTPGALIHPVDRQFDAEIRFHAESAIWDRLKALTGTVVWERIRNTVFRGFIEYIDRGDWKYKGRLLSYMYFNMVVPNRPDELHFKIRDRRIKFGRREFALTMGLMHGNLNVQLPNTSQCFTDNCLLNKFKTAVTLEKIAQAMSTADDEAKFRMGLVYLIYGIMMGQDPRKLIPARVFYIVEDLEIFSSYPWGEYMFSNLIGSWCKTVQDWLNRGVDPTKDKERPTVSGCIYAMQLWIFLAMPNIATRGRFINPRPGQQNALPIYMRWRHTEGGVYTKALSETRISPWENIPEDVITTEEEKLFVISLRVPEQDVREAPRALPSPPPIVPPPVVQEEAGIGASRPARDRGSRPKIEEEDKQRTQARRVDTGAANVGEDSISMVSVVPSEEISRIVQPYLRRADEELRRARSELNVMKDESTSMKAEIVTLRSEVAGLKAKASSTSTELREVKDQLGDVMRQIDWLKNKLERREVSNLLPLNLRSFALRDVNLDSERIAWILYLMKNSPLLQTFEIQFGKELMNDIDEPSMVDFRMDQLRTVVIKDFRASRNEVMFVKILLKCAPLLGKLLVEENENLDPNERIKIVKELFSLQRKYPKTEIVFAPNLVPF